MADTIWSDYAYGKNAVSPVGHHGNALLSRYPIVSSKNINISTNRLERRGFLHCVVRVPETGTEIHCFCVHLSLFGRARKKQCGMLVRYIARHVPPSAPLIVAGDFNDWLLRANKLLARPLKLVEAHSVTCSKLARTFPARFPLLKLDRIYVRGVEVTRTEACNGDVWPRLSDHIGLLAEVS